MNHREWGNEEFREFQLFLRLNVKADIHLSVVTGEEIKERQWMTNEKKWIAAQAFISGWVDKTTLRYLYNGIVLICKTEEKFTVCDNMDRPGDIMLSEISQLEKDKYHMISLRCGL